QRAHARAGRGAVRARPCALLLPAANDAAGRLWDRADRDRRRAANLGALMSIPLVRQHRQGMEFDSLLVQLLGVLRRGLAVDRAVVDVAVVHLARFFGKFLADIVGILGEVLAQL